MTLMTLPSSPPLPDNETFPSSPPYCPVFDAVSRKRRLSGSAGFSSDPLFSDEASEAGLDSEELPQRKKLIRGPWWTLTRSRRGLRHQIGQRQLKVADSGVWMPSDDSEQDRTSIDLSSDSDLAGEQYKAIAPKPATTAKIETSQELATRIVLNALEEGKESIDLSNLELGLVSNALLRPLHQLVLHPRGHDNFRPLTPQLELYLSGNNLRTLPTELFRLKNITVLSLRNNRLRVLPPALFQLPNLKELNLGGNELKYLPWEAISMPRCNMRFAPNPFYEPFSQSQGHGEAHMHELSPIMDRRLQMAVDNVNKIGKVGHFAYFIGTSQVTYFQNDGRLLPQQTVSHDMLAHDSRPQIYTNRSPSLTEMVLRQGQKTQLMHDMVASSRCMPQNVQDALQHAKMAAEVGNEICSVCKRTMIIVKAEWIEYWTYAQRQQSVYNLRRPFMRRVCSWACAQPSIVGSYIKIEEQAIND